MSILVVEDSYPIMIRIVSSLRMISPKDILFEASSGLEAISLLEGNSIDRVILDLGLPDMSGISILRYIKLKDPAVKVFVFTNHTDPEVRSLCMKEGADFFFDKSCELEKVIDQFRV